jgi:L-ascorbate metabolism protein UlaG (beta-lactamase superfamily)
MNQFMETDLINRIEQLSVPPGQLALWSLGQSGFVVKGGSTIAYIDPYLSDSGAAVGAPRRFPIPIDPARVQHADIVFATHEHLDHADGPTLGPLLAASPQAHLITSPQGREVALQADVPAARIIVPRIGERKAVAGLEYVAIPAAHGASARLGPRYLYEEDGEGHARWMGFLIACNGVTLYHSGDTVLIPEIFTALSDQRIDIAILPINGRDYFREQKEIVGNLWPGEAVELAAALQAKILIGCHNDLFAGNRVNPGMLFDELDRRAPWQRCHLLQPGELYLYAG